jgi:hypothetical protein
VQQDRCDLDLSGTLNHFLATTHCHGSPFFADCRPNGNANGPPSPSRSRGETGTENKSIWIESVEQGLQVGQCSSSAYQCRDGNGECGSRSQPSCEYSGARKAFRCKDNSRRPGCRPSQGCARCLGRCLPPERLHKLLPDQLPQRQSWLERMGRYSSEPETPEKSGDKASHRSRHIHQKRSDVGDIGPLQYVTPRYNVNVRLMNVFTYCNTSCYALLRKTFVPRVLGSTHLVLLKKLTDFVP